MPKQLQVTEQRQVKAVFVKAVFVKAVLASLAVLSLLCLPCLPGQATSVGSPVPKPTAANQSIYSGSTAPFTYQLVTLPYVSNGAQMAVGGAVDTTSRLSVNPQGTAENGETINMPSGATGYAIRVRNSTGANSFTVTSDGTTRVLNGDFFASYGFTCGQFKTVAGKQDIIVGNNNCIERIGIVPTALNSDALGIGFPPDTYQSQPDTFLWRPAAQQLQTTATLITAGYAQAVRITSAADSATLSDSTILINGAIAETLPTSSVPTGRVFTVKALVAGASVTNTIDGTAGYSLSSGQTLAVIWDGSAYRSIGTNGYGPSGTSDGITATNGIITAVRNPALGVSRLADFSLSATGNGGSGSQTLAAGAAWTRLVMDTQTTATNSPVLGSQFTLSTSRFLSEAVGKAYLFRMAYNISITAGGSGYLEFGFDGSAAGDGSGIKAVTPVYINGASFSSMSYLFDTTTLFTSRTTASTTSPGTALLVRFIGTGTATLSTSTLQIVDASGVSGN